MFLKLDGDGALNRQLYRALRQHIESGVLKPGDRIMPTRALRERLGLSRNVILMAYAQLQAEGYLESEVGSGTFVARHALPVAKPSSRRQPRAGTCASSALAKHLASLPDLDFVAATLPKSHFDFRYGVTHLPDESRAEWSRMERRTLRNAFIPTDIAGLPELRRAIAAHLRQHRGLTVAADHIVITSGVRETLDLTLRLCVDAGAGVVIEEPHYVPFGWLAQAYGAQLHPVPIDAAGIDTRRLPSEAVLAHVSPSHQFPTGAVLSIERRHALLDWAARCGAYLIEDDYDSEFRYDAQPLPPLKTLDTHDRVIYAGSFSKVLSSALRLGFIVAPASLLPAYRKLKSLTTGNAGTRMQSVLAGYINEGLFARHLRRMRRIYAERRATLLAAVDRHLGDTVEVSGAAAGLHVFMQIKHWPTRDTPKFMSAVAKRRVGLFHATRFYVKPPATLPVLLAFGGIEAERIEPGIRALARVIADRSSRSE
jgi:GntR family transcriptional regulator/MocR family aminotransferase